MDYILYFKVETLDEREYATSVLEENGFTCIDECGGQAAFEDGDFGLFINCARSTSLDFLQLCRMPDPDLGLLSSNPMTGAPDPRLEEWAVTGQLISPEQHFARLHWNAVRRNVYTRAIFFYWRELTSHIYAPGGVGESRDRESFEANFRGLVPPCLAALYDKQMKHAEVDQKFGTCLFTRLDENELTPPYQETASDQTSQTLSDQTAPTGKKRKRRSIYELLALGRLHKPKKKRKRLAPLALGRLHKAKKKRKRLAPKS